MRSLLLLVLVLFAHAGWACPHERLKEATILDEAQALKSLWNRCELKRDSKEDLIFLAATYDSLNALTFLMNSTKAHHRILDEYGRSPLFYVNSVEAVKILSSSGINKNRRDQWGYSALTKSLDEEISVTESLLQSGLIVTPFELKRASERYDLEQVEILTDYATRKEIENSGQYFNTFDFYNEDYRHVATKLVSLGADLNKARMIGSQMSLLESYIMDYVDNTRNFQDNGLEAVKWLAQYGADATEYVARRGGSIFQVIFWRNDIQTNKELLEHFIVHGLDINYVTHQNESKNILMKLSSFGYLNDKTAHELVRFLVRHDVNMEFQSRNKRTALHWAIRFRNLAMVKALVPHSNLSQLDDAGLSALEYARSELRRHPVVQNKRVLKEIIMAIKDH